MLTAKWGKMGEKHTEMGVDYVTLRFSMLHTYGN